jgi:hypothetical protein
VHIVMVRIVALQFEAFGRSLADRVGSTQNLFSLWGLRLELVFGSLTYIGVSLAFLVICPTIMFLGAENDGYYADQSSSNFILLLQCIISS